MKQSSTRQLFTYWNERRGSRSAPERGDIEPGAIQPVLGDSFILLCEPSLDHPFRLAGTRLCNIFGRELKGEPFVHLWSAADRDHIRDIVTIVTDEVIGAVAGVSAKAPDNAALELELMLLPLRHHGSTHTRLLGLLAPNSTPFWLGREPVESLELGPLRYLDPDTIAAAPALTPGSGTSPTRPRLTVYEGGRA
jgi:hypothetical protein